MPWYRQYRPTSIDGLHLASVRASLQKVAAASQFPHALLLTGPRGAGKTSSARILAAMLNDPANAAAVMARLEGKTSAKDLPPLKNPNPEDPVVKRILSGGSLVVQELDAASNRGIDDVRLLKEKAYVGPAEGLVTVFILDEVHMLTAEAFNALLKLLEEPPKQVVFVLATTEVQKIPETILSRVMTIRYAQATDAELEAALKPIIADQKLTIEPAALQEIVKVADGSFRDAVKYLEQVAAGRTSVKLADVQEALLLSDGQEVTTFLQAIVTKQEPEIVACIQRMRSAGRSAPTFHKAVVEYLADQLQLAASGQSTSYSLKVLQFLTGHFNDKNLTALELVPFLGLEVKALELVLKAKDRSGQPTAAAVKPAAKPVSAPPVSAASDAPAEAVIAAVAESIVVDAPAIKVEESPLATPPTTTVLNFDPTVVSQQWDQILGAVREQNSSIEALLRSAKLKVSGDRIQIEVFYQFHREQLQLPKFRAMIDKAFQNIFGSVPPFEFVLADSAKPGASLSNVNGAVDPNEGLVQLAKELLV